MPENNKNQPPQRSPRTPKEKALRIFRREAPPGGYIQRPDAPYHYGGDLGQHDPNQKVFNPERTKSPKTRRKTQ
jgi:hypothetical protein